MRGQRWLLIGALAGLAMLTAACQQSAGQAIGTGSVAATGSSTTASTFVPVTAATTTEAAPPLKFPNTDLTVRFTGYDDATDMVTFGRVTWIPGGADDGHYAPDSSDPGPHRLPLASDVTITSWSTDCAGSGGASGASGVYPCTAQQLVAGLRGGGGGLSVADLHVDGTDHISVVKEIFTP